MNTKIPATGLFIAVLGASSGNAMAQSTDQPAATTPQPPSMGMRPMPGMRPMQGMHPMQGMMDGHMNGHMMGGCPMLGSLPPGNEKLGMRMHGEMMVAIGNILIKNADNIQSKPSN